MKVHEYNEMMAYMLRPRQKFAIGGGVIEGEDLGSREGYVEPKLIIGGSRTPSKFRNKFGVRTLLTVPEDTPGYLGRTGEQVVFETEADAQRFADEDINKLNKIAQESKKRSPIIEARLQKIKDFVKAEKKAGKKKIYLDDIIEHLEGEKTVFGTGKRGIQTEQTELKSRVSLRDNVREALGDTEYDKLEKGPGGDRRIADEKKVKFNKLVQDVNRGDLPIIELGSEARGTTQNIKLYLTEVNKKRFDKMLPSLRAINSRVTQPAETLTKEGIEELKKTTTKNFVAMMKKYPSSIERRTQVFKGGARFYDAKSFALAQIGRHVTQGGTLYKHVGGDTMKDVKFRNTKTNKLITIRNIDMNSPEFKEAGETYKEFEKLKNTKIDNPLTGEKITINNAIKQGSTKIGGKTASDYLVVDHVDGVKNNPLKNLIITNQKQNLGFQLTNLTEDQKKLFYRNRLSLDDNIKRFTNYGQRLLVGGKYKTPKQTVADLVAKGEITTADKAPIPEATKTRNMFKRAGKLGLVGGLIASTAGKTEETGQMPQGSPAQIDPVDEEGFTTTEKLLAGTTAGAAYAARKPILKTLGKIVRPFGFPSVAAGFSLSSILDYEKPEDASILDRLNPMNYKIQDDPDLKMAGADLLLPELLKTTAPRGSGILSILGRAAMNPFGRAARFFTPAGAVIGTAGIAKDYYDFARDEIEKVRAMSPEERQAYNESLMDEGGMIDISREGFDEGGPSDPSKRKFMKIMGGLASLPIVGKFFRVAEQAPVVQNIFTEIQKLKNSQTIMPDWFPTFLDKFRREGTVENIFKKKKVEISKAKYDKAFAEGRGEYHFQDVARTQEYKANNPDHMDYYKLEDTDQLIGTTYTNEKVPGVKVDDFNGEVSVNWENDYSQPVAIQYVKPGMQGPDLGRLDKYEAGFADKKINPEGEFAAVDQEVYATDPDGGYDTNAIIVNSLDDMMEGTTRVMEEYATGKPVRTLSKGEGKVIEAEVKAEQAAESAAEMADDFGDFE